MTIDDPLASATAKIGWAKRLLDALHDDITRFIRTKPFASTVEYNAETGWHDVTMHALKPLPPDWPLIAGDLIQNIRNALDHVAWAFALQHTGHEPGRPTDVNFPIASSLANFERASVKRWVSDAQFEFLESMQPYYRNDYRRAPLWVLRELSNRDKHRVLHTAYTTVEPGAEVRMTFSWERSRLGELVEHVFIGHGTGVLVDRTLYARARFERVDADAKVKMTGQTRGVVTFGALGWLFYPLNHIGEIGVVVENAVSAAHHVLDA